MTARRPTREPTDHICAVVFWPRTERSQLPTEHTTTSCDDDQFSNNHHRPADCCRWNWCCCWIALFTNNVSDRMTEENRLGFCIGHIDAIKIQTVVQPAACVKCISSSASDRAATSYDFLCACVSRSINRCRRCHFVSSESAALRISHRQLRKSVVALVVVVRCSVVVHSLRLDMFYVYLAQSAWRIALFHIVNVNRNATVAINTAAFGPQYNEQLYCNPSGCAINRTNRQRT